MCRAASSAHPCTQASNDLQTGECVFIVCVYILVQVSCDSSRNSTLGVLECSVRSCCWVVIRVYQQKISYSSLQKTCKAITVHVCSCLVSCVCACSIEEARSVVLMQHAPSSSLLYLITRTVVWVACRRFPSPLYRRSDQCHHWL